MDQQIQSMRCLLLALIGFSSTWLDSAGSEATTLFLTSDIFYVELLLESLMLEVIPNSALMSSSTRFSSNLRASETLRISNSSSSDLLLEDGFSLLTSLDFRIYRSILSLVGSSGSLDGLP